MEGFRTYPKRLFWRLYALALFLSLILDGVWLSFSAFHYHFEFQYLFQFFALFGFLGCMVLILIAKGIGFFIVKDENYYFLRSKREKEETQ